MVLEVPLAGRELVLGLIADRVYEVASLDDGRLEPPPDIGTKWRSDYIRGVGRRGEHFVVVFDLGRLFASDEQAFLGAAEAHRTRRRVNRDQRSIRANAHDHQNQVGPGVQPGGIPAGHASARGSRESGEC